MNDARKDTTSLNQRDMTGMHPLQAQLLPIPLILLKKPLDTQWAMIIKMVRPRITPQNLGSTQMTVSTSIPTAQETTTTLLSTS